MKICSIENNTLSFSCSLIFNSNQQKDGGYFCIRQKIKFVTLFFRREVGGGGGGGGVGGRWGRGGGRGARGCT